MSLSCYERAELDLGLNLTNGIQPTMEWFKGWEAKCPEDSKAIFALLKGYNLGMKNVFSVHNFSGVVTMGDKYEVGQAGAVGPNAFAQHMTFQQVWQKQGSTTDLIALADQLSSLVNSLKTEQVSSDQKVAIACLEAAADEAAKGDGEGCTKYIGEAVQKSGNWILAIAEKIGVALAVSYIKGFVTGQP